MHEYSHIINIDRVQRARKPSWNNTPYVHTTSTAYEMSQAVPGQCWWWVCIMCQSPNG